MTRTFLAALAVIMLGITGGLYANAYAFDGGDGPRGWRGEGNFEERHERRLGQLTELFDLSAEQQVQVKQIITEEHEKAGPYLQLLRGVRDELHAALKPGNFSEETVRQLAGKQAAVKTEMLVCRARAMNRIYALLTPEQQKLADKLEPFMRQGKRGGGRHGF